MKSEKGQGLVEMAIILPVLLILFLGVLEVGLILRNYLVLADANREVARFATKQQHLDYDNLATSYADIFTHTKVSLRPLQPSKLGMVMNVVRLDTGWPCDPAEREASIVSPVDGSVEFWPNCDCDLAVTQPYTSWTVIHSALPGYEMYQYEILNSPVITKVDIAVLADEVAHDNVRLNCVAVKSGKNVEPSAIHDFVVVEMTYSHDMLFVPEPFQLYSKTMMRVTESRE